MNGVLFVCLCFVGTGITQQIAGPNRIGGLSSTWCGTSIGATLTSSLCSARSTSIRCRIGGVDRLGSGLCGNTGSGSACYRRGETPARDSRGNIEWCSYMYNYCNAPGAVCRLEGRSSGTCCYRRGSTVVRRCGDGSRGLGLCFNEQGCFRYGQDYRCEFNGRTTGSCCRRVGVIKPAVISHCGDGSRGVGSCYNEQSCFRYGQDYRCELHGRTTGRCCRRGGVIKPVRPWTQDEHCQGGLPSAGYCRSRQECPHGGVHYTCQINSSRWAYSERRGLCCQTSSPIIRPL